MPAHIHKGAGTEYSFRLACPKNIACKNRGRAFDVFSPSLLRHTPISALPNSFTKVSVIGPRYEYDALLIRLE